MEVAYFKILDPTDRKKSLKLVNDFMKIFGGLKGWEKVVTSEADEKTSRIFVFDKISKIEKAKEFLLNEGCLLEFELKTKDYLIMKNVDKSFFNDEINFKILENFLKKNLTLDDVLDKIKYSGRESLTKIDYLILENKKP